MPALLLYLLKVNIALLLFCLGYYAVLRQLTFYTLNRVYLLTALIFSSLYPAINISHVVENHQKLVMPLEVIIVSFNTKATAITQPIAETNYWQWVILVFWIGVVVMTFRLIIQFWSLLKLHRRSKPGVLIQHPVRIISEASNPFSFWQSVYINPEKHTGDELKSIIAHEYVHVKQWHTLDIILAELSLVFYWFNPGVWLMKKVISENLEFITDRKILQQGTDAKSYQYSLLYTSFNTSPNAIVNHFNMSTIKKRIMMMNSKKSAFYNLTRYSFIAPAIVILLLAFGTSKAAFKQGVSALKKVKVIDIKLPQASIIRDTVKSQRPVVSNQKNETGRIPQIKKDTLNASGKEANPLITTIDKIGLGDSALIVIDGKPYDHKVLNKFDMSTIKSMNILHPSTATTVLGPPAASGAILIFTKDGQDLESTKKIQQKLANIGVPRTPPTLLADTLVRVSNVQGALKERVAIGRPTVSRDLRERVVVGRPIVAITDTSRFKKRDLVIIDGVNYSPVIRKDSLVRLSNVRIRPGVSPLFVIDGKIASEAVYKQLYLDDIATFTVQKDSLSTATYGDKAKNGVIIIVTKAAAHKK